MMMMNNIMTKNFFSIITLPAMKLPIMMVDKDNLMIFLDENFLFFVVDVMLVVVVMDRHRRLRNSKQFEIHLISLLMSDLI